VTDGPEVGRLRRLSDGERRSVRRTTITPRSPRRRPPSSAAPRQHAEIAAIVVIVPARNELATIASCIRSIDRAAASCPDVPTSVVVAADSCRDATAARAHAVPTTAVDVAVVEGAWRSPSAARAAAVRHALTGLDSATTWLAHTDADCVVGGDWLVRHLAHARRGLDALAGTVVLDASTPSDLRKRFTAAYALGVDAHRHVHAANFGVRADAYLAAGGWLARTVVGEDHDLWRRLGRGGFRIAQPLDVAVSTSARRHGRVVGGFASWLARLEGAAAAGA
jgi:glycosyltransferase involved in cell wall biosynthesis